MRVAGVTVCGVVDHAEDQGIHQGRIAVGTSPDLPALGRRDVQPGRGYLTDTASLVGLPNRQRSLAHVDVTRAGAISLFAVWAVAADADVMAKLESFNRVDVGAEDPHPGAMGPVFLLLLLSVRITTIGDPSMGERDS